ncbi:hypothetical protein PVIIG_05995 [Plasmodium vivax India VII]|uniref:Uncharacterized protein n=1 Tax=Plasmodium vivax India VII TaxID=1077284 RepID=A0A0J9S9F5_PLAVI|nr:hypothetical protein PVIIG_05995 [Plasmodium vivax India VII]
MEACPSISNKYIDYKCYECLKDKFHTCYLTVGGQAYLNSPHDTRNSKIPNFTYREDILEWIVKHLGCTKVFWGGYTNIPCKYINFWLNEKIKVLYTYVSNSYFKNYEEFVKKFYKVVEGYDIYESCTKNINFLDDDDEYKKLNTLYTLYKKYDELQNINQYQYKDKRTCELIQDITNLANDIARSHKNDDEFIKILKNLRNTIKNAEGRYKTLCESDLKQLDTMVTETAFPPKVHKPPTPPEISQSSDSLEQAIPQALAQRVSDNGIPNQPQPKVDLPVEQFRSEEHPTKASHSELPSQVSPLLEVPFREQHSRGSHHASSRHTENLHDDGFNSEPFSRDHNEQSPDAHSSSEYTGYNSVGEGITKRGVITPTDGTQSYLETFKGTITGILGSVDPGPVLGVSGGMGALFLLFKEEEDDSVKFLEVLEDFHQEISEIFRNMVKI